ncbi:MAG: histidine phosphatase family protein [Betaproteobacteria bacterium]|nr:histidine phosphatase family protein [Betaproteobacteria bacterium]
MRHPMPRLFAILLSATLASGLQAQSVSTNKGTVTASGTVQAANTSGAVPSLAVLDERFGLADGLIRELRNGGYVIYVRHGPVLPGAKDQTTNKLWWRDCNSTARLAPEAQPRARAIGEALQRQRVIVAEVLASEFCRAVDSAIHMGLNAPIQQSALNDASVFGPPGYERLAAGIVDFISREPLPRTNRVLVGHALPPTLVHPSLSSLPESHAAIFKAEGGGKFHFVTQLSPGQWAWIAKQKIPDVPSASAVSPAAAALAAASGTAPAQAAVPMIDPAKELKGADLIAALRKGGYNLYMRHAQANVGQDGNLLQTPNWWENCTIQRNISDTGKEQARKVGAALRSLKIPVDSILASQFCRNRDTAHLMGLGPIEVTEDINHQIGQRAGIDINVTRFKRLATAPAKGQNTVLVSHTHGSPRTEERIMGGIQEAEIVVYLPDGKGGAEPIARIPPPEWDNLIKLAQAAPAK